jgi:DNA-binding transcriptional ArsR family regulator
MEKETLEVLKEISHKLDQLIVLSRLSGQKALEELKQQMENDPLSSKILELSTNPVGYSELAKKAAEEVKVSEITVKRKISSLKTSGLLIARRSGKEVYYENSGLLE